MKKMSKQQKFNKAMISGRALSVKQISAMGFVNTSDPAYQARARYSLNVQRFINTDRRGNETSIYQMSA